MKIQEGLQMKQNRKNKHRLDRRYLIFAAVIAVFAVGAAFLLRLRGSVKVHPSQDIKPASETVIYRQDDSRWAREKMGDSDYTLGSSGCLVSCIASAQGMAGAATKTPSTLNREFTQKQVYDPEGNIRWEPLKNAGYHVDLYPGPSSAILESCLADGAYPIARVRMHGFGKFHYVLIIGSDGGEFECIDPLQDQVTRLSDYGCRVYAVRCVY